MKAMLVGWLIFRLGNAGLPSCSAPPAAKGTVRIRWASDPHTIDPLLAATPQASEVLNLLHCSLLYADPASRHYTP